MELGGDPRCATGSIGLAEPIARLILTQSVENLQLLMLSESNVSAPDCEGDIV
jgi:hypothetical protein